MPDVDVKTLPQPTTDMNLAKSQLDEFGYCFLANALSSDEVAALRQRVEEQAAAERQQGLAFRDAGGPNQRIWFLVNKGQVFRDLLQHHNMRQLIDHLLGESYLLSSFTANIANPGGIMEMHTDQWWMPPPTVPGTTVVRPGSMTNSAFRGRHFGDVDAPRTSLIQPAVAGNAMWMLTDFTEENGATHVRPCSHLSGRQPDTDRDCFEGWVAATAPAGTALVFDGRLWHSTGTNVTDSPRIGALTYFCGPQFRQQENLVAGTASDVLKQASPELLELLGFNLWQGYGRIESPHDDSIVRGQRSLGELRPE